MPTMFCPTKGEQGAKSAHSTNRRSGVCVVREAKAFGCGAGEGKAVRGEEEVVIMWKTSIVFLCPATGAGEGLEARHGHGCMGAKHGSFRLPHSPHPTPTPTLAKGLFSTPSENPQNANAHKTIARHHSKEVENTECLGEETLESTLSDY